MELAWYLTKCVNTPFIVGYLHCQYLNAYDPKRGFLKQGLLDENGILREPLSKILRTVNLNALNIVETELRN